MHVNTLKNDVLKTPGSTEGKNIQQMSMFSDFLSLRRFQNNKLRTRNGIANIKLIQNILTGKNVKPSVFTVEDQQVEKKICTPKVQIR